MSYIETFQREANDKSEDFKEKELEILRKAVEIVEQKKGHAIMKDPEIKKIISIVESFIKAKKLICYGGTAINNILPPQDQFYNKDLELPDYDFYSDNALEDAKELADIYYNAGYKDVEAKAGVHVGTFKVFVNFMGIADITMMDASLFASIRKSAIKVDGILYAPPNFLRMAMYLELSRPGGDVSRWEKVQKRLVLLNKSYPLKGINCKNVDIQRPFSDATKTMPSKEVDPHEVYDSLREIFIKSKLVFLGGYATILYSRYMPKRLQKIIEKNPDFDMLSENPEKSCKEVIDELTARGYSHLKMIKHEGIGEVISEHYEIRINEETIAFIYKPLACHSYNPIMIDGEEILVATIDTMLSFYLAFIYADRPYYDENRILCISQFLFDIQQRNRLKQKGLLRRFSINCYGKQETLEDMKVEKSEKFIELKDKKDTDEYNMWFLRYVPLEHDANKKKKKKKSVKKEKSMVKSKTNTKSKTSTKKSKTTPSKTKTRKNKE
jgi:hypothetical protein